MKARIIQIVPEKFPLSEKEKGKFAIWFV